MTNKNSFFIVLLFMQAIVLAFPAVCETIPTEVQELLSKGPHNCEPTNEEELLYQLIMTHRAEHGQSEIPFSKSLCYVAQLHVRDLAAHKVPPPYTLHSWSKNGPWEGVRYTANHRHARLMWNKPKELTNYPGDGFEITYSTKGGATARKAFDSWKDQKAVEAIMLNNGNWETIKWRAMGVGIFGDYAVIWFGDREDTQ